MLHRASSPRRCSGDAEMGMAMAIPAGYVPYGPVTVHSDLQDKY
jgi:hypothetical protein